MSTEPKAKIHFRNEPFMARVDGKGDEPIQCTPVVYDDLPNCGVGVYYEDGNGHVWGLMSPRNLIAAWRGTEVLRRLDTIEHGTLAHAYYTGLRNPRESDMDSHVEPTISKIGRQAYEEIMAMPVPEEIIRAILDNQGQDFNPALYPITEEVRAGTIQWRQEFADAGIEHPDEVDAKQRAQEETIAKFEKHLVSYAQSRKLVRNCNGMGYVEGALLTLVEKGLDQTYSEPVVIGLAGAVGELALGEFTMTVLPFGPRNREEQEAQMEKTKRQALEHSAQWMSAAWKQPRFPFWRRPKESFTTDEARRLLERLLDEHFPSKQTTNSETSE